MSQTCKFTSPTAIPVKKLRKTIVTEHKLDPIRRLKGEKSVDICHYSTLAYTTVLTIYDNAGGIKKVLRQ
jgi:hypothetical protein